MTDPNCRQTEHPCAHFPNATAVARSQRCPSTSATAAPQPIEFGVSSASLGFPIRLGQERTSVSGTGRPGCVTHCHSDHRTPKNTAPSWIFGIRRSPCFFRFRRSLPSTTGHRPEREPQYCPDLREDLSSGYFAAHTPVTANSTLNPFELHHIPRLDLRSSRTLRCLRHRPRSRTPILCHTAYRLLAGRGSPEFRCIGPLYVSAGTCQESILFSSTWSERN